LSLVTLRHAAGLSLVMIVILTALNFVAVFIGARQPTRPALEGFYIECTNQPCWYGIVPAVTRLQEAADLLARHGWSVTRRDLLDYVRLEADNAWGCTLLTGGSIGLTRNPILESIPVANCDDLRLGDVMRQLGMPDRISSCDNLFNPVPQFDGQISVNLTDAKVSRNWLSPFDRVERIFITKGTQFPIALRWRGFAPSWRYQQLGEGETCG
jgi:hypothetical protein